VRSQRPPAGAPEDQQSVSNSNKGRNRNRDKDGTSSWDPARSWRNRQGSGKGFLSSLERRYLRDVLWALERSNKPFTNGFVLKPQGKRALTEVRLPGPLMKLVSNGLISVISADQHLYCILTQLGVDAIRSWMLAKPPDFQLMFPNLYLQLTNRFGQAVPVRRTSMRKRRQSSVWPSLSDNMKG
jgi:hypothetical protein